MLCGWSPGRGLQVVLAPERFSTEQLKELQTGQSPLSVGQVVAGDWPDVSGTQQWGDLSLDVGAWSWFLGTTLGLSDQELWVPAYRGDQWDGCLWTVRLAGRRSDIQQRADSYSMNVAFQTSAGEFTENIGAISFVAPSCIAN